MLTGNQIISVIVVKCTNCVVYQDTCRETKTDAFGLALYFSHRPIDLDNIYNQDQVKLLMKEGEELTVPDFDDIYADSEVKAKGDLSF